MFASEPPNTIPAKTATFGTHLVPFQKHIVFVVRSNQCWSYAGESGASGAKTGGNSVIL